MHKQNVQGLASFGFLGSLPAERGLQRPLDPFQHDSAKKMLLIVQATVQRNMMDT